MDELDPEKEIDEVLEEDAEDDLVVGLGPKKAKKKDDDEDSLDLLAEEEDDALPEDSYDDLDLL